MASQKPEPQRYDYDPLPSNAQQQQTQYYVVLPLYLPTVRRRTWRRCLTCATTLLLLAVAIYFLWPSDPQLKVVRLRLDRLHLRLKPKISLDITLGVTVKVRNADVYSMDYESLKVSVNYRGEQLGFVTSDGGHVKARGSSYVNATLNLDGVDVISDAIYLIEDVARGSIPFNTVSEVQGELGFFFFNLPLKAKLSCDINVSTHNLTIVRQDCYAEINGDQTKELQGAHYILQEVLGNV